MTTKKYKRPAQIVLAVFFVASVLSTAAQAGCRSDLVQLRGDWGQAQFRVELADDPAERQQGLMFRKSLPRGSGMLFVYDQPGNVTFWMRNTYVPLDLIFADARGQVQRIHHNAQPLDETLIPGGENIQHVLEINAGLSKALKIGVGTTLRHPAIDQNAALWPCE